MKTFKYAFLLCLGVSLTFSSCKKKTEEEDKDTDSATENYLATTISNDMGNISDEAGRTKNVSSFKLSETNALMSSCATLQFDTLNSSNADTIRVNFGSTNCLCNDGRYRRGSLLVIYNGKYKDSLTTITTQAQNYYVNDNAVSGSKVTKNMGHNPQGHLIYTITENITITLAGGSGKTVSMSANRQREWLNGEGTLIWSDDRYSTTGTSSGVNSNGRSYTSNITSPLIRDMSLGCRRNFVSGVIEHTPQNKPTRTIDFGDGTCDNKATVTINGNVFEVTLP